MPRKKSSDQLTELELACLANYRGNQLEAAKAAGVKNYKENASKIFNRPRMKKAVEAKIRALIEKSGKDLGKGISVTCNDIINRFVHLAFKAKSERAQVAALTQLKDIFGLSAKDDPDFSSWSREEKIEYAETGAVPASVAAREVSRES